MSTESVNVPRWQRFALAGCMFLITGVNGFLQPFAPLYLTAAGLNKSQLGLVAAIGTATALLIQPILGRLSDRFDTRRPFMVFAAIMAGLAYLAFRQADSVVMFTLLTALGVNGFQYLNAVGGVLVGRLVQATGEGRQSGGTAYAKYRLWGSVGYIVVAMIAGQLVKQKVGVAPGSGPPARAVLDLVYTYGPLLFFAIAAVALVVPEPKVAKGPPAPARGGDREDKEKSPPRAGAGGLSSPILANRYRFLLAFFLYQFGLYGASAYLSLLMAELGASPQWITAMFAAGVIVEVLVMTQIGRWTDKYGRRPAIALSFLLMPIRLLLYIPATGPLWVLCVQTLHGINFGIVGTIAVVFINDTATDRDRGTAQAQMAATMGLALSLGQLTCGYLADQYGIRTMFAIMAGVGAVAALLFFLFVEESHPNPAINRYPFLRLLANPPIRDRG